LCLSRFLQEWHRPLHASWDLQEASLEQIEARAAKHLALEHFQAINMALHRAI